MCISMYLYISLSIYRERWFPIVRGGMVECPHHPTIFFNPPPIKTDAPPTWGAPPIKNEAPLHLKIKPSPLH